MFISKNYFFEVSVADDVCFLCFRSSRMFSLYKSLWDTNFAHNLSISPSIYVGTRCILHTEVTLTVEIIFLATGFCCWWRTASTVHWRRRRAANRRTARSLRWSLNSSACRARWPACPRPSSTASCGCTTTSTCRIRPTSLATSATTSRCYCATSTPAWPPRRRRRRSRRWPRFHPAPRTHCEPSTAPCLVFP